MKSSYDQETARLLEALDFEIEIKCAELKEKRGEKRLKNLFFASCGMVLLSLMVGAYLGLSFLILLAVFFVYQGIVLTLAIPLLLNSLNKEAS